jgi:ribonuclease D
LIIDSLALGDTGLAPLRAILGPEGPRKLIHDLAFDARILAEHQLRLGNVYDTALAASLLGSPSTGLAALVALRVGVTLSKTLQHHDWRRRPLQPAHIEYLAGDVRSIPALARSLEADVAKLDIGRELEEETRYRLASALAAEPDPRPPYVRIKQAHGLAPQQMAILREVAALRDAEAQRLDVPPFKVLDNEGLVLLARTAPMTEAALTGVRGFAHPRARALAPELVKAVQRGAQAGDVPAAERQEFLTPPTPPPREWVLERKAREARLVAWRKAEAKRRKIDVQAVLPGHCLQALADMDTPTLEALHGVAGLGQFRIDRDGLALLSAIKKV